MRGRISGHGEGWAWHEGCEADVGGDAGALRASWTCAELDICGGWKSRGAML